MEELIAELVGFPLCLDGTLPAILTALYSLGYYLPKRKPLSAYISNVCAYTNEFANGPENQCFVQYGTLRIGVLVK